MPHFTSRLNVLVMPTDTCNMSCIYCFHKKHRESVEYMSIKTVKKILEITVPYYKEVNFIWHGGEPLLMGLDFYREVVKLQSHVSCTINNSVQTNLTLMTKEYSDFFCENGFKVSGSYDGVCNSELRGRDSEIMNGRQLIVEHGKTCGLIMVVSAHNIEQLIDSYLLFKNMGVNFSLNLYVDQKDNPDSMLALNIDLATNKLIELFDYWVHDVEGKIYISYFKHILDFILKKRRSLCTFTSCLGRWIGIRYNGEIVPCNRFFPAQYSYGNVFNYSDIGQAFETNGFKAIISRAIMRREKCKTCDIYQFCNGGCNNNAHNENGMDTNGGLSCQVLRGVYGYIDFFINRVFSRAAHNAQYNPVFLQYFNKQ